jgi:hypothetical protein
LILLPSSGEKNARSFLKTVFSGIEGDPKINKSKFEFSLKKNEPIQEIMVVKFLARIHHST